MTMLLSPHKKKIMTVVTVGGGRVGSHQVNQRATMALVCRGCDNAYDMAADPHGLALSPSGATVRPGYTEMCPSCYHEHLAGTVLEVF